MANVSFKICTKEQFDTACSGSLVAGALYFISDTRDVYRATSTTAATPYTEKVKLVTAFPTVAEASLGTLYLNSTTGEAKVSTGDTWITLGTSNIQTTVTGGTGAAAGKVPLLNSSGVLDNTFMPDLAISRFINTVDSAADLLDLDTAESGDWAQVVGSSDPTEDGAYILSGNFASAESWKKMSGPNAYVLPEAGVGTLGGVKLGATPSGLQITTDGTISLDSSIAGSGVAYSNGTLSAPISSDASALSVAQNNGSTTLSLNVGTGSGSIAAGDHNHNSLYATVSHNHDNTYAMRSHSHAEYSLTNHTHSNYIEKPASGDNVGYVPSSNGSGEVTWVSPTAVTSIEWGTL